MLCNRAKLLTFTCTTKALAERDNYLFEYTYNPSYLLFLMWIDISSEVISTRKLSEINCSINDGSWAKSKVKSSGWGSVRSCRDWETLTITLCRFVDHQCHDLCCHDDDIIIGFLFFAYYSLLQPYLILIQSKNILR